MSSNDDRVAGLASGMHEKNVDEFRHHKYCVVDVAGVLVAYDGHHGALEIYVLDSADDPASRLSVGDSKTKTIDRVRSGDKSQYVKITDAGLIEFIGQYAPAADDGGGRLMARAQITGTIYAGGDGVQLAYVSQAFIHDKQGTLKYEPNN